MRDRNARWEWQEEEYCLQRVLCNDGCHCLWDDVNPNEDNSMCMLDEQTPIKDCADFGFQVSDIGDNVSKGVEESMETLQMRRRRMLQFTSDTIDTCIVNEQSDSACLKYKVREGSLMEDRDSENLEWNSCYNLGFQDDRCPFNSGRWDLSEGLHANCLNDSEMHCSTNEMPDYLASDDQVDISEFHNISPEMVAVDVVQETSNPTLKILKDRKSYVRNPMKFAPSIAYPFALIKPCGVQGDVTLGDINQRLHAPLPSRSKKMKDTNPSLSYLTSSFSGKPVVVKTKIRTEGKGSITVMRTKG